MLLLERYLNSILAVFRHHRHEWVKRLHVYIVTKPTCLHEGSAQSDTKISTTLMTGVSFSALVWQRGFLKHAVPNAGDGGRRRGKHEKGVQK